MCCLKKFVFRRLSFKYFVYEMLGVRGVVINRYWLFATYPGLLRHEYFEEYGGSIRLGGKASAHIRVGVSHKVLVVRLEARGMEKSGCSC